MLPALYYTPQLHEMFWELDKIYHFTGTEMRLYYYLVRVWAELNGKRRFWHRDEEVSTGAGCSENTMRKYRKRLADAGLIAFIAGGKSYAEKTRYELCFAPENPNELSPTKRFTDEEAELSKMTVTETGMVVKAAANGLTLLTKCDETTRTQNLNQCAQNLSQPPQDFSPLGTSSFSEEKKTVKKENPTGSFSSQAALFQEERPTPPDATEIYAYIEKILKREKGDVPLTTIDRELIHAIAQKFIAAKQCSDWRDDKSQNCMIRYWRDRLQRYYASAKWGTRSDIQRAYNAEAAARNIELNARNSQKFAAEKEAYIIRLQAEQAAEAAKKQAFDATVQTAILTKVENNNITFIPRNNGNARPNNANKNRNHSGNVAAEHSESVDAFIARKLAEARAEEAALRAA